MSWNKIKLFILEMYYIIYYMYVFRLLKLYKLISIYQFELFWKKVSYCLIIDLLQIWCYNQYIECLFIYMYFIKQLLLVYNGYIRLRILYFNNPCVGMKINRCIAMIVLKKCCIFTIKMVS